MTARLYTAVTWDVADAEFGAEPSVSWDTNFADEDAPPLLYIAICAPGGDVTRVLRAHCALHRAPDTWPTQISAMQKVMATREVPDVRRMRACRCRQWHPVPGDPSGGEWLPKYDPDHVEKLAALYPPRFYGSSEQAIHDALINEVPGAVEVRLVATGNLVRATISISGVDVDSAHALAQVILEEHLVAGVSGEVFVLQDARPF